MGSFEKSRLLGKIPSRLMGKSKEDAQAEEEKTSRLLGKQPKGEVVSDTAFAPEFGEKKLEVGTILVNIEMATDKNPSWAAKAEFTITHVFEQEGRGVVYKLESPGFLSTTKSEKILREEIARGKYRLK